MTDAPSERSRVRRLPSRASYDRPTIDAILDEALICHVGFDVATGPVVIPTIHARVGDLVYIHGSAGSRMLRTVGAGRPMCLTATILDGLVLAKAHFHSSMNYRSVIVQGTGRLVTDPDEKETAFVAIVEKVESGRWDDGRQPNDRERRATSIVALSLDDASAKIRTGGPNDDPEDLALDFWAGVIPISIVRGEPVSPDPDPL